MDEIMNNKHVCAFIITKESEQMFRGRIQYVDEAFNDIWFNAYEKTVLGVVISLKNEMKNFEQLGIIGIFTQRGGKHAS